jgi:hypothetical protein
LACACLVAIDSGLPLAALADVPQQQQQAEKHGLLGRLRQMVSPAGDGECTKSCMWFDDASCLWLQCRAYGWSLIVACVCM